LKPDNILWFKVDRDKGTFQIADLGLAAFHVKDTKRRKLEGMVTMTPSGTSRYEPPETDGNRGTDVSRSRQYDIWSMGCIMLELLVWMMYGFEAVRAFRNRTDHFWLWRWEERTKREYDVHPYVSSCMDIMERQLQGDTCYKALLGLVRDRLLVIAVSEDYQSSPEFREIATELHTSMQVINRRCGLEESYLPPMDLKYPASEIEDNQRSNPPVSESHGMLAVPGQPRRPAYIAKTSQDIPTVPTTEGDDVPRVVVRRPTSELSLSTLSIQEPTILDKQEVGRDNASGKVTLC
jgi:serine/threonine protein kinase